MVEDPIIRDGSDRDNCRPCFRWYYVILVHVATARKCKTEKKVHGTGCVQAKLRRGATAG